MASEIMLTGKQIDADRAERIGMVSQIARLVLLEAALDIAHDITRNSPFGVRMTKEVLAISTDAGSIEAAVEMENRTQVLTTRTEDLQEAVEAFKEKRPATFHNR